MSTTSDPLYNIVLRPNDPRIGAWFVAAAAPFAAIADNYLVVPGADHATVGMFRAADKLAAREAAAPWIEGRQLAVTLGAFSITPDADAQGGLFWMAIDVVKTPELMALQAEAFAYMKDKGFAVLQKPESYRPHFTLWRARVPAASLANPAGLEPGLQIPCHFEVGASTDVGVYLGSIMGTTARPAKVVQPRGMKL